MSSITTEIVNKISGLQNQIWQTVSMSVSESSGQTLNFGSALTVCTPISDLYAEMTAPKLVIQFSLASMPENAQVVLLPQETLVELASLLSDEDVESIDENIVSDLRPALEGIVQGLCLAIGTIKNEPIVATGLTIRYQIFSFPPNLQKVDSILRTNVAISSDTMNGTVLWLIDSETAHYMLGLQMEEEDGGSIGQGRVASTRSSGYGIDDDTNSLEILMDIPLEISVELGRVKMLVRDVIELGSGSIVEIEKAAGEPVDVMVNSRLVARGEVVVIEDNFGVRITEILSPQERLAKLNEAA